MDEITKKRIKNMMEKYVESKVPKHLQTQLRLNFKIRGNNVTLFQERPAFMSDRWVEIDIAQFRLADGQWRVYWKDSKNKWHNIEEITPEENFEDQLKKVDEDKNGFFWV